MDAPKEIFDISLPFEIGRSRAWYIPGPSKSPVRLGKWVGSVKEGGMVNFMDYQFNPHAHGSHTETLGHICLGDFPVNQVAIPFAMKALLITVHPERHPSIGAVITWEMIQQAIQDLGGLKGHLALVVRTWPNESEKRQANHSNQDAPYFEPAVGAGLNQLGIAHWVVDLPSVDREEDAGALACHRAFWGLRPDEKVPGPSSRKESTITELTYIPNEAKDGTWYLSLQVAPLSNDAAPSRPILYR